jgi:hypothetical protein
MKDAVVGTSKINLGSLLLREAQRARDGSASYSISDYVNIYTSIDGATTKVCIPFSVLHYFS